MPGHSNRWRLHQSGPAGMERPFERHPSTAEKSTYPRRPARGHAPFAVYQQDHERSARWIGVEPYGAAGRHIMQFASIRDRQNPYRLFHGPDPELKHYRLAPQCIPWQENHCVRPHPELIPDNSAGCEIRRRSRPPPIRCDGSLVHWRPIGPGNIFWLITATINGLGARPPLRGAVGSTNRGLNPFFERRSVAASEERARLPECMTTYRTWSIGRLAKHRAKRQDCPILRSLLWRLRPRFVGATASRR